MTNSTKQSRIRWIDLIRALGAFLVVLAHVQYSGQSGAWAGISYYALTRTAVPLFFMISGYLLLSKNETYSDFFYKRALKVFLPLFIWSMIYLIWQGEGFGNPLSAIVKSYLVKFIRGPRENHLWFFYELFGLYLFTPILRIYVTRAARRDLLYFCLIWFAFIPLANLLREFTPIQIGFSYQFLGGYIGYYIFGHLAGQMEFTKKQKAAALAVFVISLLTTIIGMHFRGVYGLKTQYFEDYQSVNVALMSAASFICLTRTEIRDGLYRVISPLSNASFGIYLAHVIVMAEVFSVYPFSLLITSGSGVYMIPLIGLVGFVVTFAVIFILQKIPIVNFSVP